MRRTRRTVAYRVPSTPPAPPTRPLDGLLAGLRLALGAGDRGADRGRLARVADWSAVARLAVRHGVGALLLAGIRSGGAGLADARVERALARGRSREAATGLGQLDAMRRAVRAIDDSGIPVLVLKGLPLAQRLYGTPFARGSVDIDLLVPPAAVAAAERALRGAGWARSMPDFRETPLRTRWYETLVRDVWLDGPGGRLELHRRLLGNPFVFDPPFADLAGRGATVTLGGRAFPTLGDADQLLYLACHGLSHYWARLKWLCDLAALLRAMDDADIEKAVARGRAEGLDAALAPALTLCREALHVEPPRAASALRAGRARSWFAARHARGAWTPRRGTPSRIAREVLAVAGSFFLAPGVRRVRYRLHEACRFLIQPIDFAAVDLPDRLFYLYVPLRPVLWLRRALRRPL